MECRKELFPDELAPARTVSGASGTSAVRIDLKLRTSHRRNGKNVVGRSVWSGIRRRPRISNEAGAIPRSRSPRNGMAQARRNATCGDELATGLRVPELEREWSMLDPRPVWSFG